MKINIDIDLTPEELRRFLGLPDVQGWQQQMLENFTTNLSSSQEQQQEFLRTMFGTAFAGWQNMFTGAGSSSTRSSASSDPEDSK